MIPLSVSWEDVGLAKEVFSSMWDKAASLVVNEKSITDAPGLSNSKMVASSSNPRKPHLVSLFDKGKVTCDCINYTNKSLCSHTLAVAEKSGLLMELLQWYTRTNKTANLWLLARSSDVPKHPGAKPNGNKRKRSRVTNPQVKTCSKLSATSTEKWQSPTDHQSQSPEAPQPSPSTSSAGSAYWTSGLSQSHSTYTGPSHWSYSAGPSQLHSTYTGPSCWSAGPSQSYFTGPSHWGEFSAPFQFSAPYGPFPIQPVPDSCQFQQPSIPPQFPTGGYWTPFHSTTSPPQSCSNSRSCQVVYEQSQSSNPFTLKFMTNRIMKCQGCKGSLQLDDNSIPPPPHDLVVSRLEYRPFVTPEGTVKVPTKPSCSHYHLNVKCLTTADPNFRPQSIVLPPDVKRSLKDHHYTVLSTFGLVP